MSDTKSEPLLELQHFYVKDISFESPNAPKIFKDTSESQTSVKIGTKNTLIENDIYEVILTIGIDIKNKQGAVLLIELEQAGIFLLKNFSSEQTEQLLNTYCSNILFPYAREEISSLTTKGGFPPLLLAPVNFDALYEQKMQQENGKTKH